MSRIIPLTQGQEAFVDDEDYKWLMQWKWHYNGRNAVRQTIGNNAKAIYMHREIMNTPVGMDTDHVNHNPLDNRKENLRICTFAENQHNQNIHKNNTSGYKGVMWHKATNKWIAQINVEKKHMHLGLFDNPREAAKFYDAAAFAYYGEFANTNFA